MRKDRIVEESKNYLISVHDTLRRTFRTASPEEQVFITAVLDGIEKDTKQLEMLQEMMEVWSKTKSKKLEMIETEE